MYYLIALLLICTSCQYIGNPYVEEGVEEVIEQALEAVIGEPVEVEIGEDG